MIIQPKVRGFICTTAHPAGCAANVHEQIGYVHEQNGYAHEQNGYAHEQNDYAHEQNDYVQANKTNRNGPKNVLVIGCSNGYGLASRITSAFGFGANTLGVMFEKEPSERRPASAGWYNTVALEKAAQQQGLFAKALNMDAFSTEAKTMVIEEIKANMGKIDLVVYSLGAPRRKDPVSGEVYSSTLKPIGQQVTRKNLNTDTKVVSDITLEPASDAEIFNTVKVMGGEDWELWIEALLDADVLAPGAKTTAYTYIGKELTWPIYGGATIGKAKEDLDRASSAIGARLSSTVQGQSFVSVLKALVTQSSSAIPVMPLYISALYKVMKEEGTHEGCIEQIFGLMFHQLYSGQALNLDDTGRIRMEDNELKDSVQQKVAAIWAQVNTENLSEVTDFNGYQEEFFRLFGFGFASVDYAAEVDPIV